MFLFGDIRYLDKLIKSLYVFVNAYSTSINTADLRFSANTQTPGNEPTTSLVPFNPSKEFLVSFLSSLQAHLKNCPLPTQKFPEEKITFYKFVVDHFLKILEGTRYSMIPIMDVYMPNGPLS